MSSIIFQLQKLAKIMNLGILLNTVNYKFKNRKAFVKIQIKNSLE